MNRKVIIDTDPGPDDAVAILFALASDRFEVLGLTTVAGNIGLARTTANAGGLLAAMGRRDIPVVAGASGPLRRKTIDAAEIHGNDGLGGITLPAAAPVLSDGAVGWMAETLLSQPSGSIDILALGPLTNVAQLIERHSQVASRIGHLIVMGGAIVEKGNAGPTSEFNFAADPEATALVLASGIRTTLIPLDVTRRIRADRNYVEGLRGTVAGDTAAALLTAYVQDEKTSRPLHDPCVMVLALAPELFGVDSYRLSVNVSDDVDAGGLIQDEAGSPVSVAMRVDAAGVLALLAEGLR